MKPWKDLWPQKPPGPQRLQEWYEQALSRISAPASEKDFADGFDLLKKAAASGHPGAQYDWGFITKAAPARLPTSKRRWFGMKRPPDTKLPQNPMPRRERRTSRWPPLPGPSAGRLSPGHLFWRREKHGCGSWTRSELAQTVGAGRTRGGSIPVCSTCGTGQGCAQRFGAGPARLSRGGGPRACWRRVSDWLVLRLRTGGQARFD